MNSVDTIDKLKLCSMPATLNGLRAAVSGVRAPFAKVTQISTGLSVEFSWPAAARIIAKGGDFQS